MTRFGISGAIALSALGAVALAHNGATGMVMERMTGMSAMREAMRDLAPIMQGQAQYDELAVQAAAATLEGHAGETMLSLFPEEPIPAASYARAEIWSDWSNFAALSSQLELYAAGLAVAAPNGLAAPATKPASVSGANGQDGVELPVQGIASQGSSSARFTVAELMGVTAARANTQIVAAEDAGRDQRPDVNFAMMSAGDVFEMIGQTCAACHSLYRRGN